ncbi:MAG: glycosyltransferase, partial [Candidatus Marinimicrobia bacterium]|nr:glycosyltransferase [Candidatus Neomarinimicrobiota bacterium]
WYVQDEISSRYGGIFRKIFNYLAIRIPVKLIVDGKTILSYTVSEVQRKSSIILNGIEPSSLVPNKSVETLKSELKIPQESLVIGNIARLTHWKGQHVLINAFSKYKIYNQNAVLVLVGSPLFYNENYHKFLKDKVANLALSESVIFTGFRRDLGELLSIMDMFIYPSIEKDTSPISLISAMVYGLPIAVSDIESLKDCYEGCNDIEVFESQNEDALFQIIDKIGKSDNRENMGESIKYWAEDKFSSIKQNNKITELFQELCR